MYICICNKHINKCNIMYFIYVASSGIHQRGVQSEGGAVDGGSIDIIKQSTI